MIRIAQGSLRPAPRLALLIGLAGVPAAAETVLKIVPQADLKILDPFYTTGNITEQSRLMIYDNLLRSTRSSSRSGDGRHLHAEPGQTGLELHPARRAEIQRRHAGRGQGRRRSIRRWAARIPAGQAMMRYASEIVATGPKELRDPP